MKTLVIIVGSRDTSNRTSKAHEFFRGRLFRNTKELCQKKGYDYAIVSLNHGLLLPEEKIEPYLGKKKVINEKLIKELRPKVLPKLEGILPAYEKVWTVGEKFLGELLKPIWDERFKAIKSKGYGELCGKIRRIIEN